MNSELATTAPGPGTAADKWVTPGRFSLILAAFIFVAYPDVVLGTRTFGFRDFVTFGHPLAHYLRESFWRGEVPLWNPLNNCGIPFLAQWNTLVLYPGSLFFVLLPLPWSLGMFCLGHAELAGLGMYFLARRWTGNRLGAALAGVAFVFNGMNLNCLMWPAVMATLAWTPWTVLCVERAWRAGRRAQCNAAVVGTMQMLTGTPELILPIWLFIGGVALVVCRHNGVTLLKRAVILTIVVLLVTCLSAAQLGPFFALLIRSDRDYGYANSDWSMPGTGWANLLVPLFRSNRSIHEVFFQPEQFWTSSYYAGIGVLLLAATACWQVRSRRVWLLGAVAGITLILSLGDNGRLYHLLRTLFPQITFMRYPIKFLLLTVFCLPILAAYAFRSITESGVERWRQFQKVGLVLIATFLVLIAGILWFDYEFPALFEMHPFWPTTLKSGLSRAVFLLLITGSICLVRIMRNHERHSPIMGLAVLSLIAADTLTHAPRQNPTLPVEVFRSGLTKLSPTAQLGKSRAMMATKGGSADFQKSNPSLLEVYFGDRIGLLDDCNLLESVPKVDGFFALFLHETQDVIRWRWREPTPRSAPIWDFLGTKFVTSLANVLVWERRPNFMPWVTAGQKPVFLSDEPTFMLITSTNFNPREIVCLPESLEGLVRIDGPAKVKISNTHFDAHRVEIHADAEKPSLLVIAQSSYPSWKAEVNGTVVPIWRANYAFQAVAVRAGSNHIVLTYCDSEFYWGVAISVCCLGLCLLSFRELKRKHQNARVN